MPASAYALHTDTFEEETKDERVLRLTNEPSGLALPPNSATYHHHFERSNNAYGDDLSLGRDTPLDQLDERESWGCLRRFFAFFGITNMESQDQSQSRISSRTSQIKKKNKLKKLSKPPPTRTKEKQKAATSKNAIYHPPRLGEDGIPESNVEYTSELYSHETEDQGSLGFCSSILSGVKRMLFNLFPLLGRSSHWGRTGIALLMVSILRFAFVVLEHFVLLNVSHGHDSWFHGIMFISFISCIAMALRAVTDENAPQLVVLAISSIVSTIFSCLDLIWNINASDFDQRPILGTLRWIFVALGLLSELILVCLCIISRKNFGWRLYLLLGAKLSNRTVFDLVHTFTAAVSLDTQASLITYFTLLWFSFYGIKLDDTETDKVTEFDLFFFISTICFVLLWILWSLALQALVRSSRVQLYRTAGLFGGLFLAAIQVLSIGLYFTVYLRSMDAYTAPPFEVVLCIVFSTLSRLMVIHTGHRLEKFMVSVQPPGASGLLSEFSSFSYPHNGVSGIEAHHYSLNASTISSSFSNPAHTTAADLRLVLLRSDSEVADLASANPANADCCTVVRYIFCYRRVNRRIPYHSQQLVARVLDGAVQLRGEQEPSSESISRASYDLHGGIDDRRSTMLGDYPVTFNSCSTSEGLDNSPHIASGYNRGREQNGLSYFHQTSNNPGNSRRIGTATLTINPTFVAQETNRPDTHSFAYKHTYIHNGNENETFSSPPHTDISTNPPLNSPLHKSSGSTPGSAPSSSTTIRVNTSDLASELVNISGLGTMNITPGLKAALEESDSDSDILSGPSSYSAAFARYHEKAYHGSNTPQRTHTPSYTLPDGRHEVVSSQTTHGALVNETQQIFLNQLNQLPSPQIRSQISSNVSSQATSKTSSRRGSFSESCAQGLVVVGSQGISRPTIDGFSREKGMSNRLSSPRIPGSHQIANPKQQFGFASAQVYIQQPELAQQLYTQRKDGFGFISQEDISEIKSRKEFTPNFVANEEDFSSPLNRAASIEYQYQYQQPYGTTNLERTLSLNGTTMNTNAAMFTQKYVAEEEGLDSRPLTPVFFDEDEVEFDENEMLS